MCNIISTHTRARDNEVYRCFSLAEVVKPVENFKTIRIMK